MQVQISNYLMWQEERGFIWPTPSADQAGTPQDDPHQMAQDPIAVICSATGEQLDLLNRMLAAIRLEPSAVTSDFTGIAKARLIMSPPPEGQRLGEPIKTEAGFDFYTYHPATLLEVPEVKLIAWGQLQQFTALLQEQKRD